MDQWGLDAPWQLHGGPLRPQTPHAESALLRAAKHLISIAVGHLARNAARSRQEGFADKPVPNRKVDGPPDHMPGFAVAHAVARRYCSVRPQAMSLICRRGQWQLAFSLTMYRYLGGLHGLHGLRGLRELRGEV